MRPAPRRRSPGRSTGRAGAAPARTRTLALDALVEHGPRYAAVADAAGLALPTSRRHDLSTVESAPAAARAPTSASRRPIADDRPAPDDAAEAARPVARIVEAAWATLDRVAAGGARRAPQGSARRRSRPRQDRSPTSSRPTAPTPARSGIKRPAAGPGRPRGDRRAARGDARRSSAQPSDGSPLAGRQVAAALRRAPDRLARARPRLGDRGPHRAA